MPVSEVIQTLQGSQNTLTALLGNYKLKLVVSAKKRKITSYVKGSTVKKEKKNSLQWMSERMSSIEICRT